MDVLNTIATSGNASRKTLKMFTHSRSTSVKEHATLGLIQLELQTAPPRISGYAPLPSRSRQRTEFFSIGPLPSARWKRRVPRGDSHSFHRVAQCVSNDSSGNLWVRVACERALGRGPSSFQSVLCREHAGSDAYPGAIIIISGHRSLRHIRLLRIGFGKLLRIIPVNMGST